MAHVVTCFLRNAEAVLLVRRAADASTYPGLWAGVSGYVEGDPDQTEPDARRETREETGLTDADLRLVRAGEPLQIDDAGGSDDVWIVHPYLFETATRTVTPNPEIAETAWVQPTAILDRETVPGLWDAYRRVGPTVADVADDDTHGSAHISVRALAVLRDSAGEAERAGDTDHPDGTDDWQSVVETARTLRASHPGMAPLRTRIDRVLTESDRTPEAVRRRAENAVTDALSADGDAAAVAGDRLAGLVGEHSDDRPTVLTCSRSGTVAESLRRTDPHPHVVVAESRPGGEGVGVAESLAYERRETDRRDGSDPSVALLPDSAATQALADPAAIGAPAVDAVLVGSDAVLPDASVVNKVGTRGIALAAATADVPVFVVTARDKISGTAEFVPESADATDLYDGDAPLDVVAPLFDRTPAELVSAVLTEDGPLSPDAVRSVAEDHADLAEWLSVVDRAGGDDQVGDEPAGDERRRS
ncbi:NUDIX domain-containing protein [Salinirubrum litoreum]|uniref:NUDIX domain-containing protein n=1 Tax=Salinirubrum litoreum TaxID=1126234 RepID=A0ABD5RC02_9EURY|nr:NUDIX domain-containing protein [Salinirubrum litoreum]